MILIDISQILNATVHGVFGNKKNSHIPLNDDTIRHYVLNTLKTYVSKYKNDYGEVVVCCDSKDYWRKTEFKFYKAKRKDVREKSTIDWKTVYESFDKVKNELKEFFPYRVIEVPTAEADDVIGTICHHFGETTEFSMPKEKIMIISGDGDFQQLQVYTNVRQFDPVRKRELRANNPVRYLQEHIIRGDSGDGIPNYLSNDGCLVDPDDRQTKIYERHMDKHIEEINNPSDAHNRNINRNAKLIDLSKVPDNIKEAILESYNEQSGKSRIHMFNYFVKFKLKNLMTNINDF